MKKTFLVSQLGLDARPGVFESLKTYGGQPFRFNEHLDRFFESAKTVGLEVPETREKLRERVQKAFVESGKEDAFIRLTLVGDEIFVVVSERKHALELYQKGVVLKTSAVRRNSSNSEFPEAKATVSFLNQVLATLDPQPAGNYEILFLNPQGYLAEARIGNIFVVKDGTLLTPPPYGLLNGVTRRFVIECARFGRIRVEEKPLVRHDLFSADEAFLTNTTWEILPIREVDGRRIGHEIPGSVTARLQKLFRKGVQQETRKIKSEKSKTRSRKRL